MAAFHDAAIPEDIPGGEWQSYPSKQEEEESELVERVVYLLNAAVELVEARPTVHVMECQMCGMWDCHTDQCPVPALEHWLETH